MSRVSFIVCSVAKSALNLTTQSNSHIYADAIVALTQLSASRELPLANNAAKKSLGGMSIELLCDPAPPPSPDKDCSSARQVHIAYSNTGRHRRYRRSFEHPPICHSETRD